MPRVSEGSFVVDARRLLASWLDAPKPMFRRGNNDHGADFVVEQGRTRLVVECKATSESAGVGLAIAQVKAIASQVHRTAVPVVAVPFMGEVGKRLCAEAGVCWFDLSGNAHIVAPGLRI